MSRTIINIQGRVFGRLTVLREDGRLSKQVAWVCRCECGKEKRISSKSLRTGHSRSCGCLRRISRGRPPVHGLSRTPTYNSWKFLRIRAENRHKLDVAHAERYQHVDMDPRWCLFENFVLDMGLCPPGHTIDRIDNLKGYWPGNCRWATPKQQCANRRPRRTKAEVLESRARYLAQTETRSPCVEGTR